MQVTAAETHAVQHAAREAALRNATQVALERQDTLAQVANDWLFRMVDASAQRRLLQEHGLLPAH